jgi:predicted ester cyclase
VANDDLRDLIEAYARSRDPLYFAEGAVVEQVPLARALRGRPAIAAMLRLFYLDAFSDAHDEIRSVIVDPDRHAAVVESTFSGRHTGEVLGLSLAGRRVELPMVGVYEADGDLIRAGRLYFDLATLLGQLTHAPSSLVGHNKEGER